MQRFYHASIASGTVLFLSAALWLPAFAQPQEKGDSGNAELEDKGDSLTAKHDHAAPALAIARAVALPIPEPPPVTIPALPFKSAIVASLVRLS